MSLSLTQVRDHARVDHRPVLDAQNDLLLAPNQLRSAPLDRAHWPSSEKSITSNEEHTSDLNLSDAASVDLNLVSSTVASCLSVELVRSCT